MDRALNVSSNDDLEQMSSFADTIMRQKYLHPGETGWQDIAKRVVESVVGDYLPELVDEITLAVSQRKFMPGGRYLYASGKQFHQTQNCFAGETRFLTRDGLRTLGEAAGQSVTVMTTGGKWVEARVESFGEQALRRVTVRRQGKEKTIFATGGHSWRVAKSNNRGSGSPVNKHKVITDDLRPGDRLWDVFGYGVERTPLSPQGIQHGVVFGDGNVPTTEHGWNTANLRLCGEKDAQLLKYFPNNTTRAIEGDIEVGGLPRFFKEKPSLQWDRSYLLGWLAGYFAADGCVSDTGKVELTSADRSHLEFVREVCYLLGVGTFGICSRERVSNLTGRDTEIHTLTFMRHTLTSDFFLIQSHRDRFAASEVKRRTYWSVVSVEETDRFEEVFCAVVPDTHEFVLEDNILTGNCLLLRVGDSREEISDLYRRVGNGLMTGAGIGIVWSDLRENGAPVKGMGGTSTGPLAFMQAINEIGRHIMQGGSRRAAIWAGLHWWHPDVFDFMRLKDWPEHIVEAKEADFNAYAPMDMTNISVILDTQFFEAMDDADHPLHEHASNVYWTGVEKMLQGGEPGFSIDAWENEGENLRNAPLAAHTNVLTNEGYKPISDLVGTPSTVWTGEQWASDVVFKETNSASATLRVVMTGGRVIEADPTHPFMVERYKGRGSRRKLVSVDRVPASDLVVGDVIASSLPTGVSSDFSSKEYTLGWLYGDGSFRENGGADLTLCTNESKACAEFIVGHNSVNQHDGRGYTRFYFSTRQFEGRVKETVPSVDVTPSFVAGLFDADGNFGADQKRIRLASVHEGFLHDVRRGLEALGILSHVSSNGTSTYGQSKVFQLVIAASSMKTFAAIIPTKRLLLELDEYRPYRTSTVKVVNVEAGPIQPVYCADVRKPEHTFVAEGVVVSNCTEVTSHDDNDICNLGSINMARVETVEEFDRLVELGTAFLLCGTLYSKVPYEEVAQTREKNRRLGLGLMGIYEWLVSRGHGYEPNAELERWLRVYTHSDEYAKKFANRLGCSVPVKTRAIAPTGTIGILAETTTGIEPLFAVAYKRRYLKGTQWHYQYVVEPTAKRLADTYGVDPDDLETALTLSRDPRRRLAFQAFVQQFVDHGISSTLNLPSYEEQEVSVEQFGGTLLTYLPDLRGVTVYPDGARGGQPLTAVPYAEAVDWEGFEYEEVGAESACVSGVCGV